MIDEKIKLKALVLMVKITLEMSTVLSVYISVHEANLQLIFLYFIDIMEFCTSISRRNTVRNF